MILTRALWKWASAKTAGGPLNGKIEKIVMIGPEFTPPSKNTHFLVTGGGKGITAESAVALANAYQSRFTLLGRSELLDDEPRWSVNLADQTELKHAALEHIREEGRKVSPQDIDREVNRVLSSREIKHTLDRITQAGGSAEYLQADITNREELRNQLTESLSTVNALLHGAGALADKYIEDKTEKDFDLVYGVKIGGLKNILEILPPHQLDYLILFSSVAGFYGNAGQADYSLSNEILNKLAFHLKGAHPHCQVLAVDWGPWDGGMVTPQLKRILTRKNIALISPEEGTRALVDLLSRPQLTPQYVVGTPLPIPPRNIDPELRSFLISRKLTLEKNPFLVDHVIGGNAVLPTVCAVAWFIKSCRDLHPEFKFHAVRDYRVFKGIVFDETATADYQLELKEIEKTPEKLSFLGKISSTPENGNIRYHYQAEVELRRELPERPLISEPNLTEDSTLDIAALYSSKVLFHGPGFQGVKKILNISAEGLTTECLLPRLPAEQMGQFAVDQFNPLLADVHLQALLIWAHHNLGAVGLPLRIASGIQYELPPLGSLSYATMKVQSSSNHKLVADVISHDRDGLIYSEVRGAEITLTDNLYDLFQNNHLEKEPVWI
jgi:NAD(P)-dependent dehydrogenase (short-subunit alcohol dehydrogenase family)